MNPISFSAKKSFEPFLDEVYRESMAGNATKAGLLLLNYMQDEVDNFELHQSLFNRMKLWEYNFAITKISPRYITLLLAKKDRHRAFEVYRYCQAKTPRFMPEEPEQFLPLIYQAIDEQLFPFAVQMTRYFEQRYPTHNNLIVVQFLRLFVWAEKATDLVRGRRLLTVLLKYKNHPLSSKIKHYIPLLFK